MLCPSNPVQISETYNDLLTLAPADFDPCVDQLGSPESTGIDHTLIVNPCRRITGDYTGGTPLAPLSEPRRFLVEDEVYQEFYNTNYTASWFLVRSEVFLDGSGNLKNPGAGCEVSLKARGSTRGPLTQARLDTGAITSSLVPLMGCGTATNVLDQRVGPHEAGTMVAMSFTKGPVLDPTMQPPGFAPGTSKTGSTGWWATWNNETIQDYRGFAPVHRRTCNVLFADGSIRSLTDKNEDGLVNNGFSAAAGFASDEVEVTKEELYSRWSLRARW
jgi:prepilin-type processing-associated H-X9-DG protein